MDQLADGPELPGPFASIATNVPLQLSGMPRQLLHAAAASCTIVAVIREARRRFSHKLKLQNTIRVLEMDESALWEKIPQGKSTVPLW